MRRARQWLRSILLPVGLVICTQTGFVATSSAAPTCDELRNAGTLEDYVTANVAGWEKARMPHDNGTVVYHTKSSLDIGGGRVLVYQIGMHNRLPVPPDELISVLASPEAYPDYVDGVIQSGTYGRGPSNDSWMAYYEIDIGPFHRHYVLHETFHDCNDISVFSWRLAAREEWPEEARALGGKKFKYNTGYWLIASGNEGGTEVWYQASVDPAIWIPAWIRNLFVRGRAPGQLNILTCRIHELNQQECPKRFN